MERNRDKEGMEQNKYKEHPNRDEGGLNGTEIRRGWEKRHRQTE